MLETAIASAVASRCACWNLALLRCAARRGFGLRTDSSRPGSTKGGTSIELSLFFCCSDRSFGIQALDFQYQEVARKIGLLEVVIEFMTSVKVLFFTEGVLMGM